MGQEYQDRWPNPADDKYYRVPREMGIARTLPRSEGISTSDLIARIQNATLEKNKDDWAFDHEHWQLVARIKCILSTNLILIKLTS